MTGSKLVELCSNASPTQRVGSTLVCVMDDQVPTDGAEIEIKWRIVLRGRSLKPRDGW
jgi:hypothetical protein